MSKLTLTPKQHFTLLCLKGGYRLTRVNIISNDYFLMKPGICETTNKRTLDCLVKKGFLNDKYMPI